MPVVKDCHFLMSPFCVTDICEIMSHLIVFVYDFQLLTYTLLASKEFELSDAKRTRVQF